MADEEVVEEEVADEGEAEEIKEEAVEKTASEVEELATKLGWNPNYEGGDRDYVSAEDFILRSKEIQNTMSKQLKTTKREMEGLKRGVEMLKTHNDTVYNVQVKALKGKIRELEAQKAEAVEDGDAKAVAAIDNQIREINDIPDALPADTMATTPPEMEVWLETNDWYSEDKDMRAYADYQGEFNPELKALPFPKLLKEVTKLVKDKFPENFPEKQVVTPPPPSPVEGAANRSRSGGKKSGPKNKFSDLSRSQQDIAKQLSDSGIMTIDAYIADLEKEAAARRGEI